MRAWLRLAGAAAAAFTAGAASEWWLGGSWPSRALACLTAAAVMLPALRRERAGG